jgi:tRNA(fMet)-specific endonuclease VapC
VEVAYGTGYDLLGRGYGKKDVEACKEKGDVEKSVDFGTDTERSGQKLAGFDSGFSGRMEGFSFTFANPKERRPRCETRIDLKYLLDTNTLIHFFKGKGNVAARLLSTPPTEIGVPSVVQLELLVGISKSTAPQKRIAEFEEFLSLITVVPFGTDEAKQGSEIRVKLEGQGRSIGPYDLLIAATAMVNQGILVTHNTREFSRVEGLQIQDWY